ncbi:SDR family NAD(P)-dependent oxidoreductase [Deinococcus radiophilus]|uniref:SDR family NAD(P)-dependent oxidoreductase n=1 Tax=Deinococcus radiophilus TaxID=32062 RepID=A0A3S0JU69_9DEIO|nr:SDR family NAD(P)-dependent oxidoreductase [Deinococcus radiophilus]RTR29000.1 SDR family NAD(P)-dependent oxidoreductase [Deinococcus radiophilus]UFA49583.1 SDR family NAD(P)-dependent oxidoreductase [Deinococcus radiophilus]
MSGKQQGYGGRRVVVLTGASSGIGAAAAQELSARGHALVLVARRREQLHQLARQLDPSGTRVMAIPADVSDPADRAALIGAALAHFGRIDVLINNAGISTGGGKWWEHEDAAQVLRVNLEAPIELTRLILPQMVQRGSGQIVNVASVAGQVGVQGVYSASKFGLRGFSFGLRRELLGTGVTVSVVSPGFVRTEMTARSGLPMPGPEAVARAMADILERPRREVTVPGVYRLLSALGRVFPGLTDRLVRRYLSR